jgi:hypothetical protein
LVVGLVVGLVSTVGQCARVFEFRQWKFSEIFTWREKKPSGSSDQRRRAANVSVKIRVFSGWGRDGQSGSTRGWRFVNGGQCANLDK